MHVHDSEQHSASAWLGCRASRAAASEETEAKMRKTKAEQIEALKADLKAMRIKHDEYFRAHRSATMQCDEGVKALTAMREERNAARARCEASEASRRATDRRLAVSLAEEHKSLDKCAELYDKLAVAEKRAKHALSIFDAIRAVLKVAE